MTRRVHDRGGWPAGPIDRTEHDLAPWEKEVDALLQTLPEDIISVDEFRRAMEGMEPEKYEALSYYARWVEAIESVLVEKGVLVRGELDRRMEEMDGPSA